MWKNSPTMLRRLYMFVSLMTGCFYAVGQEITPITLLHNLPVVKGKINDKDAYFILDTGASVTLLNNALAEDFGFSVVQNEYWENYVVTGLGGKHLIQEARNVVVILGDQRIAFINKSCSLQKISKSFASDRIKIAGIIGSDIMGFLGSRIDFANGYVVFYHKPIEGMLTCKE